MKREINPQIERNIQYAELCIVLIILTSLLTIGAEVFLYFYCNIKIAENLSSGQAVILVVPMFVFYGLLNVLLHYANKFNAKARSDIEMEEKLEDLEAFANHSEESYCATCKTFTIHVCYIYRNEKHTHKEYRYACVGCQCVYDKV